METAKSVAVEAPRVVEEPVIAGKPTVSSGKPEAVGKKPVAEEVPAQLPVAPYVAPAVPEAVVAKPEVAAASARTAEILETISEIVEAVGAKIEVVPSLVKGEGEVMIHLSPAVLDGSEIKLSAKDGALSLQIIPATPEAAQLVAGNIPQLERALAEHAPAFRSFTVALAKK